MPLPPPRPSHTPATGLYSVAYTPTVAGQHQIRWVATGTNASAYTDSFTVRDTTRLPVVSLTDAKAYLNITTATSDEELRRFLDVITDAGEQYTGRVFGRRTVIDTLSGRVPTLPLSARPILSITTVVEAGVTLTTDDYALSSPAGGVLARTSGTATAQLDDRHQQRRRHLPGRIRHAAPTDIAGALGDARPLCGPRSAAPSAAWAAPTSGTRPHRSPSRGASKNCGTST